MRKRRQNTLFDQAKISLRQWVFMLEGLGFGRDYEIGICTVDSRSSIFPFDCPQGGLFLERHPRLGRFQGFVAHQPESLLACRHLELRSMVYSITDEFAHRLESFRGSLSLSHFTDRSADRDLVDALLVSKAHLDSCAVDLSSYWGKNLNVGRLQVLTSLPCKVLIWRTNSARVLRILPHLVQK